LSFRMQGQLSCRGDESGFDRVRLTPLNEAIESFDSESVVPCACGSDQVSSGQPTWLDRQNPVKLVVV